MKRILFVCRFNCFRSQIAAGFFNKYCPKKIAVAQSAGLIQGDSISTEVKKFAKLHKLKLTSPSGLKRKIINEQDIFVIVADDVPPKTFEIYKTRGKQVKVWKIKDLWKTKDKKKNTFLDTTNLIKNKVIKLIEELESS